MFVVLASIPGLLRAQQPDLTRQTLNALLFAELDYRERENTGDDGLAIGQLVGQLNYTLGDRFTVFSEVTLTSIQDQSLNFEFERLFARYDFSDQFKVSGGRYHTPVGYWNAAFHHGSWLQTTVSRPQTMRFGSHVVPIHFIGGLVEGSVGDSAFSYRLGAGSGRSEDDLHDTPDAKDAFDNTALIFGGSYRGQSPKRFEVGVTGYVDEPMTPARIKVDERLFNAYAVLLDETPELIVEYTYADHDAPTGSGKVHSIYAQLAYRLDDGASNFKPYLRIEDLQIDDSDPLLGGLNEEYEGVTAGLRWDFAPFGTLKTEVRHEKFGDRSSSNSVWLQLSFVHNLTGPGSR